MEKHNLVKLYYYFTATHTRRTNIIIIYIFIKMITLLRKCIVLGRRNTHVTTYRVI